MKSEPEKVNVNHTKSDTLQGEEEARDEDVKFGAWLLKMHARQIEYHQSHIATHQRMIHEIRQKYRIQE